MLYKKLFSFLVLISLIFIFMFVISFVSTETVYPAYQSVSFACSVDQEQYLTDNNLFVAGAVGEDESGQTFVYISPDIPADSKLLDKTTKHEYCHLTQAYRRFSFDNTCEHKFQKFMTELECQIVEEYPDFLYNYLNYIKPE